MRIDPTGAAGADAARTRQLPNFVVIGAQKCATTSLHRYLSQHPDVYLPVQKELHYFSCPRICEFTGGPGDTDVLARITGSPEGYAAHYAGVRGQAAIGEISPSYLYFSEIAGNIREQLGDVKIIAMLRNPVQKAYSQYLHLVRDNRETLGFHDALMAEDRRRAQGWSDFWRYAESSLYAGRLGHYLEVFGPARVKVIIFEEFAADPRPALSDLLTFLSLRDDVAIDTTEVHHRSGKAKSRLLSGLLAKGGPLSRAARSLLPRSLTDAVQRRLWALNIAAKDPIDRQSRDYLEAYFRADVLALEALLGRSLPWFRNTANRSGRGPRAALYSR